MNLLAVVQAILLSQTRAASIEEFIRAATGRIGALAKSHSLISAGRWRGAELRQIVEDELAAYRADNGKSRHDAQIEINGPSVTLAPDAGQSIALAVHELATNAVKYGALSHSSGSLSVDWRVSAEGLILSWAEAGGPPVSGPPERKGFGMQVIAGESSINSAANLQ
jgi:two-component sensor histidine kinase